MSHNTAFKICLILSACIHAAVFIPWPFLRLVARPEISFQRIELTYFEEDAVKDVFIKDIRPVTSVGRGNKKADIATTKLEKVEVDLRSDKKATAEKASRDVNEIPKIAESIPQDGAAKKENGEGDAAREEYCLRVREKIKFSLEKNRRNLLSEGEICVRFIIEKGGALKGVVVEKSSGKDLGPLTTIAFKSIRESAPFAPFSAEMGEEELLFRLPIRFTYE